MTDTMGGEGGKAWNGGLAGEHVRRENAIHTLTYTDTWCVCVCIYVSQSKRENHPFPQEGGWEIEWPYIHTGENHPVPQGGGGDAAEAEGYPVPQGKTAGDILFHRGWRGEYTMTSITLLMEV